jgi:hypothetical protein
MFTFIHDANSATTGPITAEGELGKSAINMKGTRCSEFRRNLLREGVVTPASPFNLETEKEGLLLAAQKIRLVGHATPRDD